MKKFEVGKIYTDGESIEIKILKRTDKTITFIYTKKNWLERNIKKQYRKKIDNCHNDCERINFGTHWSCPYIVAILEN